MLYLPSQNFLPLVKPDFKVLALLQVRDCDHVSLIVKDQVKLDMSGTGSFKVNHQHRRKKI